MHRDQKQDIVHEWIERGRNIRQAAASRPTKVARSTIGRGLKDLQEPGSLSSKVRRKGAGRPTVAARDATLLSDLERLLEPATMGDPIRPLRWVSKSHDKLATAPREMGHKVSASTIPKLLPRLGYSRHANRKNIDAKAREFQADGESMVPVGTKKKVDAHDFENKELGKVVPCGVHDVGANSGYIRARCTITYRNIVGAVGSVLTNLASNDSMVALQRHGPGNGAPLPRTRATTAAASSS